MKVLDVVQPGVVTGDDAQKVFKIVKAVFDLIF